MHTIRVQCYLGTSSLSTFSQPKALCDESRGCQPSLCKQGMREDAVPTAISGGQNLLQLPQCVAEFAATSVENRDVAVHLHFTELLDTSLT